MSSLTLPPAHHQATLDATSPPVVLGRFCPITGDPLRAGDDVVICDARPGSDPIHVEGWVTCGSCPHCGATINPAVAYTPAWGSGSWAAPPPALAPSAPPSRSVGWLGPLAILLLLGALALAVAAVVFFLRTRETEEPVAGSVVATADAATATAGSIATADAATAATATAAATTPAQPTPLPGALPSPTPAPSKTPAPLPVPPTPTPPSPTPTIGASPITALVLVNPANERSIRALRADDTVDLSDVGHNRLTVRADVDSSAVESIMFLLDGDPFCPRGNCVENVAPYFMGGDQGGDAYEDWDWSQMLGSHTLTAIACTGDNASDDCFPAVEVNLVVRR
ncbi:MAG: hypothetical protein KIT52_17315 [Anaerolineae bacterium]|nr:hypothetical protein [Anaerolineae bacterium]